MSPEIRATYETRLSDWQSKKKNMGVSFIQTNPKKAGSKSAERYDRYKAARSMKEYFETYKGTTADMKNDFVKGFMTFVRESKTPKPRKSRKRPSTESLPCDSTKIELRQANPKRAGTKSYDRYERYKGAKTFGEMYRLGGSRADAAHDLAKGFITVIGSVADNGSNDSAAQRLAEDAAMKAGRATLLGLPPPSSSSETTESEATESSDHDDTESEYEHTQSSPDEEEDRRVRRARPKPNRTNNVRVMPAHTMRIAAQVSDDAKSTDKPTSVVRRIGSASPTLESAMPKPNRRIDSSHRGGSTGKRRTRDRISSDTRDGKKRRVIVNNDDDIDAEEEFNTDEESEDTCSTMSVSDEDEDDGFIVEDSNESVTSRRMKQRTSAPPTQPQRLAARPPASSNARTIAIPDTYAAKNNDTPFDIARKFKMNVDDILRLNKEYYPTMERFSMLKASTHIVLKEGISLGSSSESEDTPSACFECESTDSTAANKLLSCSREDCDVIIHQGCLIPSMAGRELPSDYVWTCDRCEKGRCPTASICYVCDVSKPCMPMLYIEGASRWYHYSCANETIKQRVRASVEADREPVAAGSGKGRATKNKRSKQNERDRELSNSRAQQTTETDGPMSRHRRTSIDVLAHALGNNRDAATRVERAVFANHPLNRDEYNEKIKVLRFGISRHSRLRAYIVNTDDANVARVARWKSGDFNKSGIDAFLLNEKTKKKIEKEAMEKNRAQWMKFRSALESFHAREGHCDVPLTHVERLASSVQYKLGKRVQKLRDKRSVLDKYPARASWLESVDFRWHGNVEKERDEERSAARARMVVLESESSNSNDNRAKTSQSHEISVARKQTAPSSKDVPDMIDVDDGKVQNDAGTIAGGHSRKEDDETALARKATKRLIRPTIRKKAAMKKSVWAQSSSTFVGDLPKELEERMLRFRLPLNHHQDDSTAPTLPLSFESSDEYVKSFFSLLLSETEAELSKSVGKCDVQTSLFTAKVNRISQASTTNGGTMFLRAEMSTLAGRLKEILKVRSPARLDQLQRGDVVLCTKTTKTVTDLKTILESSPQYEEEKNKHAFAFVKRISESTRSGIFEVDLLMSRKYADEIGIPQSTGHGKRSSRDRWMDVKRSNVQICVCHVEDFSMTTIKRQASALGNVSQSSMERALLHRLSNAQQANRTISELLDNFMGGIRNKFIAHMTQSYNESQIEAIFSSTGARRKENESPFTLIQGPPGTGTLSEQSLVIVHRPDALHFTHAHAGKTHCLLGILNANHLAEYHRYYDSIIHSIKRGLRQLLVSRRRRAIASIHGPTAATQRTSEDPRIVNSMIESLEAELCNVKESVATRRPRTLVVAPSNTAVDEIARRVLEKKFVGPNGKTYRPVIVRLGTNGSSKEVEEITVRKKMNDLLTMSDESLKTKIVECNREIKKLEIDKKGNQKELIKNLEYMEIEHFNFAKFVRKTTCATSRYNTEVQAYDEKQFRSWIAKSNADDLIMLSSYSSHTASRLADSVRHLACISAKDAAKIARDVVNYAKIVRELSEKKEGLESKIARAEHTRIEWCHKLDLFEKVRVGRENKIWSKGASGRTQRERQLELAILNQADIVFATLSGSGLRVVEDLENGRGAMGSKHVVTSGRRMFNTIIMDEACQCVELLSIIPLRFQAERCVLVGDPKQLPATTFSRHATSCGFGRSLFERLQSRGDHDVHFLNTQYRCRPEIAAFSAKAFYDGKLKNGPNVVGQAYTKEYHADASSRFVPFKFFNLVESRESRGNGSNSTSWCNEVEATFVASMISSLIRTCRDKSSWAGGVGVITPYKAQQDLITRRVRDAWRRGEITDRQFDELALEVNTVDAFQGREKDIIIFSCVRAGEGDGDDKIGFLRDARRMNVALTRARFSCWIVGHKRTLQRGSRTWAKLIEHAKQCNAIEDVEREIVVASSTNREANHKNGDVNLQQSSGRRNERKSVEGQHRPKIARDDRERRRSSSRGRGPPPHTSRNGRLQKHSSSRERHSSRDRLVRGPRPPPQHGRFQDPPRLRGLGPPQPRPQNGRPRPFCHFFDPRNPSRCRKGLHCPFRHGQ